MQKDKSILALKNEMGTLKLMPPGIVRPQEEVKEVALNDCALGIIPLVISCPANKAVII